MALVEAIKGPPGLAVRVGRALGWHGFFGCLIGEHAEGIERFYQLFACSFFEVFFMVRNHSFFVAAVLAGVSLGGIAQGSIIYQAFTATTATTAKPLDGLGVNSTPTPGLVIDNGPNPGSDVWSASSYSTTVPTFTTDSTQAAMVGTTKGNDWGQSATLPVTLLPDATYVLTANVDNTQKDTAYSDIGIGLGNPGKGLTNLSITVSGQNYTVNYGTTGYSTQGGASTYFENQVMTITLTTASNLATGKSLVEFTWIGYHNVAESYSTTVTGLTSASDVSLFQYQAGQGSIKNLSLTENAVPEPAALGLFAIGTMLLLLVGRKRPV